MKFKAKAKDCQLLVKAKTSIGESIDEKELDRFSRVYLRGFLKPKMVKRNLIEYTGPVGISLYERLKKPTTKREFLFILEQIVVAVQKLQANGMGLNNLVMDLQHVYINEVTKEIQFIYIPTMKNGLQNLNLVEFIESIAYSVKPADNKDNDFVARFIYFFKAMVPFDINKVESFVAKEDRSVINTIKKQNAGQSGFMTDKPRHYYDHYAGKEKSGDDDPTGLLVEDDDPTGLLVDDENDPTGLLVDDDEPTGLLNADDNDEATGHLSDNDADDDATGLLVGDDADILSFKPTSYLWRHCITPMRLALSLSTSRAAVWLTNSKTCPTYWVQLRILMVSKSTAH